MPENTKPKEDTCREKEPEAEKILDEAEDAGQSARSPDRQEKSYYYDDAHGYEIYNPDEDEDEV
jgi:hypothetical protein